MSRTNNTTDNEPERSEGESASANEDPIEALAGNLGNLTLPPSGTQPHNRKAADSQNPGTEDKLQFDPADYYKEEVHDMLEKFLRTNAPSDVKKSESITRIRVLSPSFTEEGLGNLEDLNADWTRLQESGRNIDFQAVKRLAISHRCLGGNWFIILNTGEEINSAWKTVARATVRDQLGTHAKVTPREEERETHAISVYTKDFTDRDDVMRVEAKLRKLGCREMIRFKPRAYSRLGVFAENEWGLRPSIFTSKWYPSKLAGNIRDFTTDPWTEKINKQSSE